MAKVNVVRDAGHPWDGRRGFDLMTVDFENERERDVSVGTAAAKFWQPWIVGFDPAGKPSAVFYKPSGLSKPWEDGPNNPHPGCVNGVEIAPYPPPDNIPLAERLADQADRLQALNVGGVQALRERVRS